MLLCDHRVIPRVPAQMGGEEEEIKKGEVEGGDREGKYPNRASSSLYLLSTANFSRLVLYSTRAGSRHARMQLRANLCVCAFGFDRSLN